MGRFKRNHKVTLKRFVIKVNLGKPIKLSDISVKVRDKELRFVFDKYGDNSLFFELSNLFGRLSNSGYSKNLKGNFVHFILKKQDKVKWKSLHGEKASPKRYISPEFGQSPLRDTNNQSQTRKKLIFK